MSEDLIANAKHHRALVIGYGSIGKRHIEILNNLGFQLSIYSKHLGKNTDSYFSTLNSALEQQPTVIAICSQTDLHGEHFSQVFKACPDAKILIEKPMGFLPEDLKDGALDLDSANIAVGYNLRFHPQVLALKNWLKGHKIYHASLSIQRHLPSMRKNSDYTKSYSCFKAQGGGVLKDFSHDLDLALGLFGSCHKVLCHGGKFGDLYGDADDHMALLMECKSCPSVMINMSYLNPKPERKIQIVAEHGVAHIDLDQNTGCADSPLTGTQALQESYLKQWQALLNGVSSENLCQVRTALKVEELIFKCSKSEW